MLHHRISMHLARLFAHHSEHLAHALVHHDLGSAGFIVAMALLHHHDH